MFSGNQLIGKDVISFICLTRFLGRIKRWVEIIKSIYRQHQQIHSRAVNIDMIKIALWAWCCWSKERIYKMYIHFEYTDINRQQMQEKL